MIIQTNQFDLDKLPFGEDREGKIDVFCLGWMGGWMDGILIIVCPDLMRSGLAARVTSACVMEVMFSTTTLLL